MADVIILGGNHHNTLGVIRALGEAGLSQSIKLIMVNDTPDFVYQSKYIKKANYRRVPDEDGIAQALNDFKYSDSKPVIICCGDSLSSFVDRNYDELSNRFVLPNAKGKQGEITRLMSKEVQMQYAEKLGIDVPTSLTFSKEEVKEIKWDIYPCIVKPIDSIIGGKADIHICKNRQELINDVQETSCIRFQVQRYIDKDFEYQLIGCSLDGGEKVIIPGFTRLIRQPKNTNTGYLRYIHRSKLDIDYSIAEQYVKEIGYSGLFSLEFLRGKDGKDYFMEINMRNDGNAYCVTAFGVNLPLIWYKHSTGKQYAIPEINPEHSVLFMPELMDVKNIRSVGIFKWLHECFNADCHANFKFNDQMPFFSQLGSMVKGKLKRIFKKELTTTFLHEKNTSAHR